MPKYKTPLVFSGSPTPMAFFLHSIKTGWDFFTLTPNGWMEWMSGQQYVVVGSTNRWMNEKLEGRHTLRLWATSCLQCVGKGFANGPFWI
jgi:hypothetical protein